MPADQRGSLIKRGKTWSYVIQVPDPATGKTKPRWKGGFATKKEAENAREAARVALRAGTYVADTRQALGSFLHEWIDGKDAPARATGEAKLAAPEYQVEIIITAAI